MPDDDFELGSMRSRVLIQSRPQGDPEPIPEGAGDELVEWHDLGTHWAEVVELSGRELFHAQQVKATIGYRVRMRRVADLDPGRHRLVYRGSILLNPEYVRRVGGRNEFVEVLATRLVGEET